MLRGVKKLCYVRDFMDGSQRYLILKFLKMYFFTWLFFSRAQWASQSFLTGLSAAKFDSLRHDTAVRFDSPLHYAAKRLGYQLHNAAGWLLHKSLTWLSTARSSGYYFLVACDSPLRHAAVRNDSPPLHDAAEGQKLKKPQEFEIKHEKNFRAWIRGPGGYFRSRATFHSRMSSFLKQFILFYNSA